MSLYDLIAECKAEGMSEEELLDAIHEYEREAAMDSAEYRRFYEDDSTPEEQAGWAFEDSLCMMRMER